MSHDTAAPTQAATITVIGPLDVRSLTATRDEVYRHVTDHDTVLDLTRCEWLDGSALRMLVAATIAAQRGGHRLILRGCGPRVRRMLHVTGVRPRLELEPAV
jgi:anti-anti-sigma factor